MITVPYVFHIARYFYVLMRMILIRMILIRMALRMGECRGRNSTNW